MIKAIVYGLLDVCTLGHGIERTISGERLRLPVRWHRWYPADYEPQTVAFLRAHCHPGATVIDIGAHLGLLSVIMARRVGPTGRVYSFEPTPQTRSVLESIVRLNDCDQIIAVRPEAVSGTTGTAVFHDTGAAVSNANSLIHTDRSRTGLEVPTIRLDDFVAGHGLAVDCLKIDVEGAELDLLRGASETFLKCRPKAVLALHPRAIRASGGSLEQMWELFVEYRLTPHRLHGCRDDDPFIAGVMEKCWFVDQEGLFEVALLPE